MIKQFSTQELADFMGVTRQGLKKMVDNETLEGKLLEKGLKYVGCEKQGRKNVYSVEEIQVVSKDDWEEYMKKEFPRIRKREQFIDYSALRLDPENPTLTSQVSKAVNINKRTGYEWDNYLIEKQIMMRANSTDEDNYWVIIEGKIYPAEKEEYDEFFQKKKELLAAAKLNTEIRMITDDDIKKIHSLVDSQLGCFYFKSKGILINNLLEKTQDFLDRLADVREDVRKKYNIK